MRFIEVEGDSSGEGEEKEEGTWRSRGAGNMEVRGGVDWSF